MAYQFHSPVNFWLELPMEELYSWTMIADAMRKESEEKAEREERARQRSRA